MRRTMTSPACSDGMRSWITFNWLREAFEAWRRIRKTDDARLYLASFLLSKRWDEDPR